MSYQTNKGLLIGRLKTISGLKYVLGYEPRSIQETPMMYCILDRASRASAGQVTAFDYQLICRLFIRWQDNEQAEVELDELFNTIPAAIDANPRLLGVPSTGNLNRAMVHDVEAEYVKVADVLYRVVNYKVGLLEKAAYQSGI